MGTELYFQDNFLIISGVIFIKIKIHWCFEKFLQKLSSGSMIIFKFEFFNLKIKNISFKDLKEIFYVHVVGNVLINILEIFSFEYAFDLRFLQYCQTAFGHYKQWWVKM